MSMTAQSSWYQIPDPEDAAFPALQLYIMQKNSYDDVHDAIAFSRSNLGSVGSVITKWIQPMSRGISGTRWEKKTERRQALQTGRRHAVDIIRCHLLS